MIFNEFLSHLMKISQNIDELSTKIRPDRKMIIYKKNMDLFLAQLCMFITSQKMLENTISFEKNIFQHFLKSIPEEQVHIYSSFTCI